MEDKIKALEKELKTWIKVAKFLEEGYTGDLCSYCAHYNEENSEACKQGCLKGVYTYFKNGGKYPFKKRKKQENNNG